MFRENKSPLSPTGSQTYKPEKEHKDTLGKIIDLAVSESEAFQIQGTAIASNEREIDSLWKRIYKLERKLARKKKK